MISQIFSGINGCVYVQPINFNFIKYTSKNFESKSLFIKDVTYKLSKNNIASSNGAVKN